MATKTDANSQQTQYTWTANGKDGFGKTSTFEDYLSAGGLPGLYTPSGTAIQDFTVSDSWEMGNPWFRSR